MVKEKSAVLTKKCAKNKSFSRQGFVPGLVRNTPYPTTT